jgi:hypothetical protein
MIIKNNRMIIRPWGRILQEAGGENVKEINCALSTKWHCGKWDFMVICLIYA